MTHPEAPEQPKKISEQTLREWADQILSDTMIGTMLAQSRLQTDNDGNIEPHVLENLKTMARVGARMSPDPVVTDKLRRFLTYLETGADPGAERN